MIYLNQLLLISKYIYIYIYIYCNYNERIGFTLNICKTHSGGLFVLAEGARAHLRTLSEHVLFAS